MNDEALDDTGKPIPESMLKFIQTQTDISDDLRFPPSSGKFSSSREASKNDWILEYFSIRSANKILSENQATRFFARQAAGFTPELNRFRGSLLGLAIGDATGTTLEFTTKGSFEKIDAMQGGGPFKLKKGQWTDDTSMMYCLAHSLTRKNKFDPKDQMDLYLLWRDKGVFSSNGKCFDIGNTVNSALNKYKITGDPNAGPTDAFSAGNGSLMRLAPIPLYYFKDFAKAVYFSGLSSKTTHGALESVDSCRYYGGLIWGALHGASKDTLLSGLYSPIDNYWNENNLCDGVKNIACKANYKNKCEKDIRASGYVLHTLEAALWAFYNSESFEEGLLLAVNLGEDADTTGAVYGQLAGAYYGECGIQFEWIKHLAESHAFYLKAEEIFNLAIRGAGAE